MSELVKKLLEKQQGGPQFEEVVLPSLGLYYGENKWSPVPIPEGKLKIRAWTVEEEKIMNTQRYLRTNKAIDMVFDRCCQFPDGFKADDLLIGDRAYLLFAFRGVSYGNNYTFSLECTNEDCKMTSPHDYDLNIISNQVTWADKEKAKSEPIMVRLPDASEKVDQDFYVGFRFQRHKDIKSMDLRKKSRNYGTRGKDSGPDDTIVQELLQTVVQVDGIEDPGTIAGVINSLSVKDISYLRAKITDLTPGVVPQASVECPHCGNNMEVDLPITESFFRYTPKRRD